MPPPGAAGVSRLVVFDLWIVTPQPTTTSPYYCRCARAATRHRALYLLPDAGEDSACGGAGSFLGGENCAHGDPNVFSVALVAIFLPFNLVNTHVEMPYGMVFIGLMIKGIAGGGDFGDDRRDPLLHRPNGGRLNRPPTGGVGSAGHRSKHHGPDWVDRTAL